MKRDLSQELSAALRRHAPGGSGVEPALQGAIAQLAGNPGKLLRAQLVFAGAARHGLPAAQAAELACAIEFFHTASLVLDDLPCMDDATLRRGRPCVHRLHGEATAILAALALINRGYALIGGALAPRSATVRAQATACLDRWLGVGGLVGGQAWDLAFARSDRSARRVAQVAAAKTGALFALSIQLPAALARPSRREWRHLRALCVYWGQLFQIADDLHDVGSSTFAAGKSTQRDGLLARPNLALALGEAAARERMARLARLARRSLGALGGRSGARWSYLAEAGDALAQAFALEEIQTVAA